jgi:hypothetical protein
LFLARCYFPRIIVLFFVFGATPQRPAVCASLVVHKQLKVLFEVQWRQRLESGVPKWETSAHLLRSNICRKKNLKLSTCYEFRASTPQKTHTHAYTRFLYNNCAPPFLAGPSFSLSFSVCVCARARVCVYFIFFKMTLTSLNPPSSCFLEKVRACSLDGDWSSFSAPAFAVTHAAPNGPAASAAAQVGTRSPPPFFQKKYEYNLHTHTHYIRQPIACTAISLSLPRTRTRTSPNPNPNTDPFPLTSKAAASRDGSSGSASAAQPPTFSPAAAAQAAFAAANDATRRAQANAQFAQP